MASLIRDDVPVETVSMGSPAAVDLPQADRGPVRGSLYLRARKTLRTVS